MNLYFGCLLCCYLFCLFLFYPIFIHLYTLCHFGSGEVDSWSQIRFPPSGGVFIFQFCLILLKYHHKLYLHILKRDDSSLSHCVIRWRLEKIFLDGCWLLPFARMITIGSLVLVVRNLIGASVPSEIWLMNFADVWMEATHACVSFHRVGSNEGG